VTLCARRCAGTQAFGHGLLPDHLSGYAQILDLRSSIVRQACLAVSELSAALAFSQAFEPLADALVDALLKQTSVSIAIIATSAVSAAHSIIHNSKHGFHRVVAKLCAASKSKSPVQARREAASHQPRSLRSTGPWLRSAPLCRLPCSARTWPSAFSAACGVGRCPYLTATSKSFTGPSLHSSLTPMVPRDLLVGCSSGHSLPCFPSARSPCSGPSRLKFRCDKQRSTQDVTFAGPHVCLLISRAVQR